jgi:hypothetical protein
LTSVKKCTIIKGQNIFLQEDHENDGRNEANPPQSFMADGTLRRYDRADGFG